MNTKQTQKAHQSAQKGQRLQRVISLQTGQHGTIVGSWGCYLRIQFDGEKRPKLCRPNQIDFV